MKAFSHLHTSLIFLNTKVKSRTSTDDVFFLFGQTGLHWAAKHGNDDLIKLLAGTHKSDVNARTVQCLFSPPYIIIQVSEIENMPTNVLTYVSSLPIYGWSLESSERCK